MMQNRLAIAVLLLALGFCCKVYVHALALSLETFVAGDLLAKQSVLLYLRSPIILLLWIYIYGH